MKKPAASKRFPAWVRGLGVFAFGLLTVATLLVTARWLVVALGHQAAERVVRAQRKAMPAARLSAPPVATEAPAAKVPGMPLGAMPHFGAALTGEKDAWKEFSKKLEEITAFCRHKRIQQEFVDGVWSFRSVLLNMGIDVPETMTEAEAAAEYLKQADRFSGLLAQWREAVAKGPLDEAADYKSDPNKWRFSSLFWSFSKLLAMTSQARLQCGDTAGAWADWQAMNDYSARLSEYYGDKGSMGSMGFQTFDLARLGLRSGAWTDDQLAEISSVMGRENALAEARRSQEEQKKRITDYYTNFHEHEEQFSKDFLKTPSRFDQFTNQVKLKLITEQQIHDNMEVALAAVDRGLSRFDPETGFYIQPTKDELEASGGGKEAPGLFDSFYFMIAGPNSLNDDEQSTAGYVIQQQSRYDQFRLAAALETYQRQTGKYPDNLDAISSRFPGGVPRDTATGQPYYYQKEPGGGYTLWGTGIDGKSDGGNEKSDVVWKKQPSKSK